uniref:Replication-associated protein n=1 Tax=clictolig virus 1 TaxID=2985737 RepID=A0A9Y1DYZ4_9VIRU|nr:MAG: replication-associated protein [clictolig virus 1]
MQGKRWVFTIFFPDVPQALAALGQLPSLPVTGATAGTYGGAQIEICPTTGSPHMQGWCGFPSNKRLSAVKLIHPTAHWEVMLGTIEDNQAYCSKSATSVSDYVTWGEIPRSQQGKRSDLDSAVATLRAAPGTVAEKIRAVAEEHSTAFVKYYKGFEVLAETLEDFPEPEEPIWRPWQMSLKLELEQDPDDRHLIWYNDPVGGQGKSRFVNYYTAVKSLKATALSGKLADMRFAYAQSKARIVFFDIARAEHEYVGHMYTMAEELKNGRFMNTKWKSKLVSFQPPHVVFFANIPPDTTKWSVDRLHYREFANNGILPLGGPPQFQAASAAIGGAGAPAGGEPDFEAELPLSLFN